MKKPEYVVRAETLLDLTSNLYNWIVYWKFNGDCIEPIDKHSFVIRKPIESNSLVICEWDYNREGQFNPIQDPKIIAVHRRRD